MKYKKKILVAFLIMIISIFHIFEIPSIADVGDFETYDSGGGFSSSYDSYSSSSRDYDYNRSSSSSGDFSVGGLIFFIIIIVIILASKNSKNQPGRNVNVNPTMPNENYIINSVKAIDELFNPDVFKEWSRDLFVKLQYAWADRDWSAIRCFETEDLYEQHSSQLQRYVQNKQINKIERVSVNWVKFYSFEQIGDKDVLSVILNSKMTDYIVDEETNKVLKGNPNGYNVNTYKLTFVRKTGVKTKEGKIQLNTTNCPNCGAPTEITSAGKCPYCGSVMRTGEHGWALSNLERFNGF